MWGQYTAFLFYILVAGIGGNTKDLSTKTLDLKLPWVQIPAVETYYVCQQFTVPDDRPYHVTQFDVLINNTAMVHHLLLFGCEFGMEDKGPHPCGSIDYHCRSWLTKWDVGMDTTNQMPPNTGVRFGKKSFKYLLLQIHWNNNNLEGNETGKIVFTTTLFSKDLLLQRCLKESVKGYIMIILPLCPPDTSGIRLTYTSELRKHDIGNVQVGQNKIDIPPFSPEVIVAGKCSSKCTALMLPRSIFIAKAYLHMHALGEWISLDVQKDREVVTRIASERDYNYTVPVIHNFSPAHKVDPGDEIRLTCRFSSATGSRYRNETVRFGKGTNVEMCYAFIMYYPNVMDFDQCIQDGDRNINCDIPS